MKILIDGKVPQNEVGTFMKDTLDAVALSTNIPVALLTSDDSPYVCGVDPAREHGDKWVWVLARRLVDDKIEIIAEGEIKK